MANNSRFLILPWISVKCLASKLLALSAKRISHDWLKTYSYPLYLLETFVDPQYYAGSSYKGAGWQELGLTSGEGLVRPGHRYTTTPKRIFVKPLCAEFRSLLCSEVPPAVGLQ